MNQDFEQIRVLEECMRFNLLWKQKLNLNSDSRSHKSFQVTQAYFNVTRMLRFFTHVIKNTRT